MQNKQTCSIDNCLSNTLRIKNISCHSMPADKPRFDSWCTAFRRNDSNFVVRKGMKICSLHFRRSSFEASGQLKFDAVPQFFPPRHDVRCCIQGCSSRQSTNQVFQRFPENNDLCMNWVDVIQKHNGHPIVADASYVCSLHFASNALIPNIFPQKPPYCNSTVVRRPSSPKDGPPPAPKPSSPMVGGTSPAAKRLKSEREVEEIIILDDDDDDDVQATNQGQSTSAIKRHLEEDPVKSNIPMRLLHRITQLRNENAKTEREVNVMKRKYLELKKRCDSMGGI